MSWTPWIQIESENTSNEEVKQLYERTRNPVSKKLSDLVRISSLMPQTADLINKLCASVYKNATGLSTREKEITALIVSSLNGCVH